MDFIIIIQDTLRLVTDQYRSAHNLVIITDSHHVFYLQGSVEFIEAPEFLIEVNVESPSIDELAKVHHNYTDYFGSVMLQMVSDTNKPY